MIYINSQNYFGINYREFSSFFMPNKLCYGITIDFITDHTPFCEQKTILFESFFVDLLILLTLSSVTRQLLISIWQN